MNVVIEEEVSQIHEGQRRKEADVGTGGTSETYSKVSRPQENKSRPENTDGGRAEVWPTESRKVRFDTWIQCAEATACGSHLQTREMGLRIFYKVSLLLYKSNYPNG